MENKGLLVKEVQIETNFDKEELFKRYVLWKSIPYLMKNPSKQRDGTIPTARNFALSMGVDDENLLELIELPTSKAFAEKYIVDPSTLSRWSNFIKENGYNDLPDMRNWAMGLSNNLLMSLYSHAMKKGNPLTIKLWFQLVNQWSEKATVEHKFIAIKEVEHEDYDPIKHAKENKMGEVSETETGVGIPQG